MRTPLAYSVTERRRRHLGALGRRTRDIEIAPKPGAPDAPGTAERLAQTPRETSPVTDPTSRRARAAGGPLDVASYNCACGLTFSASVSTTVACPHCGAEQDW
jgi:hypothetical protein